MRRRAVLRFLFIAAAVCGCGGREASDFDAQTPDASYDLNVHFGECCDRTLGGLGRPCTEAEIEAGPAQRFACPSFQYCGISPADDNLPAEITCCGDQVPPAENSGAGVPLGCPPWPGGVDVAWGDCCYNLPDAAGPNRPYTPFGGVPGACPADASTPHNQCPLNQYCGKSAGPDADPFEPWHCCGDRTKDQGTVDQNGVDPNCPPQFWEL